MILAIIKKHGAVSSRQILAELEDPPSRTIIHKDLQHLKDNGLIYPKGATRTAMWVLSETVDKS